jgi:hypothetical protein
MAVIDRSRVLALLGQCKVGILLVIDGGQKGKRHTTGGIPRWSPTLVLVARFSAYLWQSGRDAQFSLTYGRMCLRHRTGSIYNVI